MEAFLPLIQQEINNEKDFAQKAVGILRRKPNCKRSTEEKIGL
jgi:hypothetical protein